MAGGTVTNSWTGVYSRSPITYSLGPPPTAPLAVNVTGSGGYTAGQWLFCLVSWRQDAGTLGYIQYPSTVSVCDDAGNFWIPLESGLPASGPSSSPATGIVRCSVWMAPAARVAGYVFISQTNYQAALGAVILAVDADCPWYEVTAAGSDFTNQGTSVSLSQTATSGLFTAGLLAWDIELATVTTASTGWTAETGFSTTNGGLNIWGDLVQKSFIATTTGSALTLSATLTAGPSDMDFAATIITVQGVTNAVAFPYSLPMENWPVLITEIAAGPVLNANPLILNGTTGWTGQGAALAEVAWPMWNPWPSYQALVTPSLSVTPSGSATSADAVSEEEPVSATTLYSALAYVYSVAGYAGGTANVFINWFNSSFTYMSTTSGIPVTLLAGTWTQLTFAANVFPPAGAAYAAAGATVIAATGDVPSSAVFYIGYCALTVADSYENVPPDQIAWTDVSARNFTHESLEWSRGIQYEQQSLEAGTLSVSLQNTDAGFTFGNTESAYWPNAGDTDVPVRLRAVWPGSVTPYYPLFSGYTDEIDTGWDDDWYPYVRITGSDAWSRLTQQMLGCAEQDVLEESALAGYWPCSQSGANLAPGYTATVAQIVSPAGTGGATASFTSSVISLAGDPGVSCWQSVWGPSGESASLGGMGGVGLGYYPPGGAQALPSMAGADTATLEFWMSPQAVSADQPDVALTLVTAMTGKGPAWAITINNASGAGSSTATFTYYENNSGRTAVSNSLGTQTFLGTDEAVVGWYFSVQVSQDSGVNVAYRPAGAGTSWGTWSVGGPISIDPGIIGFTWGAMVSPAGSYLNTGTSYGTMAVAIYGIALYSQVIVPARQVSHFVAANTAFATESDCWRLARIAGYSGFSPVLAMRGLDLPAGTSADVDMMTGATDTSGQVVSSYFTNVTSTTLGAMFVNGAGALAYRRRLEWYDRAAPQWVTGEDDILSLSAGLNPLNATPSVTGWLTENGATLSSSSQSAAGALFIPYCGVFHGNGSTGFPQISYGPPGGAAGAPVTPGCWYSLSGWLYSPQGFSAGVLMEIQFYSSSSSGSLISSVTYGPWPVPAGGLIYLTVTGQAPAGAVYAGALIAADGTPASTVLFYVADVQLTLTGTVTLGGLGAAAPEVPYMPDVKISSDRALLYNEAILTQYGTDLVSSFQGTGVLFTPSSGVVVQVSNEPSVALRGAIPYTVTLYSDNTAQALPYYLNVPSMEDYGSWITQTLAAPLMRPESVTITPVATGGPALLMGLGCEVGDSVTFRRRPMGSPEIQIPAYISKLSHAVRKDDEENPWVTRLEESPFPQGSVLVCDDVIHGTLTGGNLLGF